MTKLKKIITELKNSINEKNDELKKNNIKSLE